MVEHVGFIVDGKRETGGFPRLRPMVCHLVDFNLQLDPVLS
ncbi:MAG: hypothetical protein ACTSUE_00065 [Promethearchaeota archaeon]